MPDAPSPRVYEVRCTHCETSFPPEARLCVHCGRRLGREGPPGGLAAAPALREAPGRPSGPEGLRGPFAAAAGEEDEELEGRTSGGALWVATAALAVLGSLLRTCQGS